MSASVLTGPGPRRGDSERCPGCGCLVPVADRGDGVGVPVQPLMVTALRPLRNLLGPNGKPLPVLDPVALLGTTTCRPDVVFLPHSEVCLPLAHLMGRAILPAFSALDGPPPPCAACGKPWVDHQREGCACPKWIEPPKPAEPTPESDGV